MSLFNAFLFFSIALLDLHYRPLTTIGGKRFEKSEVTIAVILLALVIIFLLVKLFILARTAIGFYIEMVLWIVW
jgi:hypothetical protein